MDERDWIERARSGDQDAFHALVERHQAMVYNLAYRMTHHAEDAADLTQEVFLSMWRGLPRFRGESAVTTWLYRLTANAAIDLLRREKRRPVVPLTAGEEEGELDLPDPGPTPEQALERGERNRSIREGLRALSPEHRLILLLREGEGLSYREIAQALGLEEGTVKSRLARARMALADFLRKTGNFPPESSS